MRKPLRSLALPAAAALALLAGCSSGAEAGSPSTSSSTGATPAMAANSSARTPTAAEVRAAVPPLAELPAGWRIDTSDGMPSPADAQAKVSPPKCQALFDQLHRQRKDAGEDIATAAERHYRSPDSTRFVSVSVDGYAGTAAENLFGAAAEALADCPRFQSTAAADPAQFRASPLSFPRLGDETLALRFLGTARSRPFTLDFVAVRVGRTSITAQQLSFGDRADADLLVKLATSSVRALPAR